MDKELGGQVEIWDKDLWGLSGNIEIPIIPLGGWEKETTSHWILSFWNHSHSKTSTLLPSTMWHELGVSYNWGLISLIITSPNSDGGWQLYPPSHPQLIIKLKKWKSTLIKESTCQLSSCSNRLMNFQTLKTHSPSMVETLTPASDIKVQWGWEN